MIIMKIIIVIIKGETLMFTLSIRKKLFSEIILK